MNNTKGFTLIELVIVILALGIFVFVAIPQFLDFKSTAASASKKSASGAVRSALGIYMMENQQSPTVTQLTSYIQESNLVAVASGVQVTIGDETHVVPTYTDDGCQTPTNNTANDLVKCVGEIST